MKNCLCLLLALCLPLLVHANGSAMGSGNNATGGLISTDAKLRLLEEHPTVSIQSEDLHIRLYAGEAGVDLTYKFRNDGRRTNAIVGFPSIGSICTFFSGTDNTAPARGTEMGGLPADLKAYTISLNGKPLAWRRYSMGKTEKTDLGAKPQGWSPMFHSTEWLVSDLPLAADSLSTIHITYRCPYELSISYVSDDAGFSDATFAYKLSTGRNWHGPIHEGHVEIECVSVEADHVQISPANRFRRVGRSFVWEFDDLKPDTRDDILVIADPEHEMRKGGYIFYPDRWYYSPVACTATASSELREDGRHFSASNLTGKGPLCWAEGVEGDGIGESVALSLKKACRIDGFTLRNGFHQSDSSLVEKDHFYAANNRVARLEIKVDDHPSFQVEAPDTPNDVFIPFPNGSQMAHKVKLTIAAVYRGTKFRDTCIGFIGLRQVLTKKPNVRQAR